MEKITLHIDENGKTVLFIYKNIESDRKKYILRGNECYGYLNKLSKNKIANIYENPNGRDVVLEYNNFIIELNDYEKLLRRKSLIPILDNIRLYGEKQSLKNRKHKKVTRKNKYTKCKIIATGLTLIIVAGCIMGMFNKSKSQYIKVETPTLVDDLEEDFITSSKIFVDETKIVTLTNKEEETTNVIPCAVINYENRSDTPKALKTREYYGDLINKYATMYGLDPELVTAIATQERGIHSGVKDDGGATGLMQVQNEVWVGKNLSAHNFETNTKETIVVDEESLSNLDYSIKVGCMILQTVFKYMNYNTLAAVQCYNMGYGNMQTILNAYSCDSGKSVEEILNDVTDTNWMNYRYIIKKGDQEYIEKVFSWLGDDIQLSNKRENGQEICFNINQLEQVKTMH